MAAEPSTSGHLIAVTGIPSSGKSTVSQAVSERSSRFQYFDGDEFIRRTPKGLRLQGALEIFGRMLDELEAWMTSTNVILDASLPASYVERTRQRFERSVMLVSLRIEQKEWRRRDSRRADRGPLQQWDTALTALQGPENLYDLVVDTTHMTPDSCAETIVSRAQELWPDVRV